MTRDELFDKVIELLKGPESGYIDFLQSMVDSDDYLNLEELKELAKSDPWKIARWLINEGIIDERYFVTDSEPTKMKFNEWLKENYNLDVITFSEKPEGYKRQLRASYDYYLHPENYEDVETKDSKISDIIKEKPEGYVIYSEKGKRLSKAYKTKKEAEERLKQIEMFKHMKKDALEHPELYNKKIKITVNNVLSNMIDRLFGQTDVVSRTVKGKNEIEYVLLYDGRVEYLLRRFRKPYKVLDSRYKNYDIEKKEDYWQVWIDTVDEDRKLAGDFPSEEEAREWIDAQTNTPTKSVYHTYDVYYTDYETDKEMVEENIRAKSEAQAKKIVKSMYGKRIYGYPHDAILRDSKKEIKDNMVEEVKRWLEKYLVKKDDPNNKLGKTHIRPLKNEERLPRGVHHKAATETSGIVHYKDGDYYWYIDGNDNLQVERHIRDSLDKRFVCESYFDINGKGLEDRFETNHLDKAREWVWGKTNKGYLGRIIDKESGEIWTILPDEEEELMDLSVEPEKNETVHLWNVEWYNKNGVKFRGEFDAEEDAKAFIESHQDEDHVEMKIVEEDRSLTDSALKVDPKNLENKIKNVLLKFLKTQGYDESDLNDWFVIEIKPFTNDEGDSGIHVQIRNDLYDYYELPDETVDELNEIVKPGYFEPYYETVWDAYMFDTMIKDSENGEEIHTVKYITYTQYDLGFDEVDLEEDEEIVEEYETFEEAEEAAKKNMYGTKGQYVEVYLDEKHFRDYEA